jgi:hypothetical protein
MSPRECKKYFCNCLTILITIFLLLLAIFLLVCFKPKKPTFSVQQLEIQNITLSGQLINSTIQITLLSTNPNQRVGIYFDQFSVYATFNNTKITGETIIKPFTQRELERKLLYISLIGNGVLDPSISYEMGQDIIFGELSLAIQANGQLHWKFPNWMSPPYPISISCVSEVFLKENTPYMSSLHECNVSL